MNIAEIRGIAEKVNEALDRGAIPQPITERKDLLQIAEQRAYLLRVVSALNGIPAQCGTCPARLPKGACYDDEARCLQLKEDWADKEAGAS